MTKRKDKSQKSNKGTKKRPRERIRNSYIKASKGKKPLRVTKQWDGGETMVQMRVSPWAKA